MPGAEEGAAGAEAEFHVPIRIRQQADLAGCIVWQRQVEELVEEALEGHLIFDHATLRLAAGTDDHHPVGRVQGCYLLRACTQLYSRWNLVYPNDICDRP